MSVEFERKWETRQERKARSVSDESRESYYGVPVIHKPHWNWLIIAYFFLGGLSGASYVIASIAALLGGPHNRSIARVGRYISLAALLPSPVLLILDLGRPERFHHMLRVFKLRSPMSVGTWILSAFSLFCGLAALVQGAQDGLLGRRSPVARAVSAIPMRVIGAAGIPFGFLLAGYTGVLVAATAVPLWTKRALLMGPLFLSSAMSSAAAAIALALSLQRSTDHAALERLERLDMVATAAELVLMTGVQQGLGPVIREPMLKGRVGMVNRVGVMGFGTIVPLAAQALVRVAGRQSPRGLTTVTSAMTLIGGFLFRYVIVTAGRASADDPKATFELARDKSGAPR